jgi:hypothetical protein
MKLSLFVIALVSSGFCATSENIKFPFSTGDEWVYSSKFPMYPYEFSGTSTFKLLAITSTSDTSYFVDVDVTNTGISNTNIETAFTEQFSFEWDANGTKSYSNHSYFGFLNSCAGADSCSLIDTIAIHKTTTRYSHDIGTISMSIMSISNRYKYYDTYNLISYNGQAIDSHLGIGRQSGLNSRKNASVLNADNSHINVQFLNRMIDGKMHH